MRVERALCQLRTERNSVVTSAEIHCSFFSASFKLHVLCHQNKCSVSVVTTKLVSTAIGGRMEIRVKRLVKKKVFMTKL